MPDQPAGQTTQSRHACPICEKPSVERYRPFCSKRCADVDLGRWLNGAYAIPAVDDPADEEDADDVG